MPTVDPLNRKRYFLAFPQCGSEQREKTVFLQGNFGLTRNRGCLPPNAAAGLAPLIHCRNLCGPDFGRVGSAVSVDTRRQSVAGSCFAGKLEIGAGASNMKFGRAGC